MTRFIVPALFAVGVLFLLLGISWNWLNPPSAYWSDEKAREYVEAFTVLHAAQDRQLHGTPGNVDNATIDDHRALTAARERYMTLTNELEQARHRRNTTGTYLVVIGLITVGGAIVARRLIGENPAD